MKFVLVFLCLVGTIWASCTFDNTITCTSRARERQSTPSARAVARDVTTMTTIGFDDTGGGHTSPVPSGYQGFTWNNMYTYDKNSGTPSGYLNGVVSPNFVAYNGFADPISFHQTSNAPFTFVSVYVTGAWNNGLNVHFQGSLGGSLVFSSDVVVDTTAPTQFTFNHVVDRVDISTSGGVSAGYNGGGSHAAFDNLVVGPPQSPECPPGQYLKGSTCTNCPLGTANDGYGPCEVCPPGHTATVTGSASCTPCPAGQYHGGGAGSCKLCLAGFMSEAGAGTCSPCPSGTYSGSGADHCHPCDAGYTSCAAKSSCTACPAGKYSKSGSPACWPCPPGSYSGTTGSASCTECPANTWSAGGKAACTACTSPKVSPPGSFAAVQCQNP